MSQHLQTLISVDRIQSRSWLDRLLGRKRPRPLVRWVIPYDGKTWMSGRELPTALSLTSEHALTKLTVVVDGRHFQLVLDVIEQEKQREQV